MEYYKASKWYKYLPCTSDLEDVASVAILHLLSPVNTGWEKINCFLWFNYTCYTKTDFSSSYPNGHGPRTKPQAPSVHRASDALALQNA